VKEKMESIYALMERFLILAVIGFVGESLLPKGVLGTSAKRALSLLLLLYAAEPLAALLKGG